MGSIIRLQEKGVYSKLPQPNGQIKYDLLGWKETKWIIATYPKHEDIISITKNEEETRTYKVKYQSSTTIAINKTFIGSLSIDELFKLFIVIDSPLDWRFKYLEKIWDYTKPIKQI